MNRNLAAGLGALAGLVSLIAMVRLVTGAFGGAVSGLAWTFVLVAMVPWVGYAAWRARHGRLSAAAGLAVLVLCGAGLVVVWILTLGAVLALVASLASFVVIWVHDWPVTAPAGESRFVRIDELVRGEDEHEPQEAEAA
jgi:hypothetical protein